MPVDQSLASRVLEKIRPDELAQLGCDLVNIPSPTGGEKEIAEFILGWFEQNGIRPIRRETEAGRPNAVGILKGTGGGTSLMFNGHMDTSFTGTEEDRMIQAQLEPLEELRGELRDGTLHGLGISNMKGGVAAFMIAGKALKESGVELKGDVILAAVVGEISRTPIERWQTKEYRGEGAGTRHILLHGIQSDYAVVADGSDLNIVWTQAGVVDLKITTYGKAEAAWGTKRATHPPRQLNAILKMIDVVEAIDRWADRFEEDYIYQSPTGPIFPKVNVGAIEGGAPFRPNYFPGICSIYVDVRIPPGVRPVTVQRQIEEALAPLGVEYDLEMYKSLLGHEGKAVEPLVESLEEINQLLFGKKLEHESPSRASIWTDTNIYNELGIPAVKIGPRGKRTGRREQIPLEELVKAAKIYALVALDICSRPRG